MPGAFQSRDRLNRSIRANMQLEHAGALEMALPGRKRVFRPGSEKPHLFCWRYRLGNGRGTGQDKQKKNARYTAYHINETEINRGKVSWPHQTSKIAH